MEAWLLLVMGLVAMTTAVPVLKENKKAVAATAEDMEVPLTRAKRSDEVIMFGNHQNVDVNKVKKSMPNQEAAIDRSAKMTSNTAVAEDMSGNPDIKTSDSEVITDTGDLTVAQLLGEEVAENEEQNGESDTLNEVQQEDNSEVSLPENLGSLEDFYYYYGYPGYDSYRKKRSAPNQRNQRSIPAAFTAEGMGIETVSGDKKSMRVKRDLTEEDIETLLALEDANAFGDSFEYPGYYGDEDEDLDVENWPTEYNEGDEVPYEWDWEDPYGTTALEELYTGPSEEELEEARARLTLLSYLQDDPELLENLREYYLSEGEEGFPENGEFYESDEDIEDDDEPGQIEYRSVVYEGQPGIFIPVKRQYISMVPGARKRSDDSYPYEGVEEFRKRGTFFPYSEEPRSHWGAFVEEKRNAAEYKRIFKLAQLLRGKNDDDLAWEEYRKK